MDLRCILVALDFSPHSEEALAWGGDLAIQWGARLVEDGNC